MIAGLALGVFSALADHWTTATWLGQLATPWVLVASYVGARARSAALAAAWGVIALVLATGTYYTIAALDRGLTTLKYTSIWLLLSLSVGSLFGALGWRSLQGSTRGRIACVALIASVPFAESILLSSHLSQPAGLFTFAVTIAVAIFLPFVQLRDLRLMVRLAASSVGLIVAVPVAMVFEVAFDRLGILGI